VGQFLRNGKYKVSNKRHMWVQHSKQGGECQSWRSHLSQKMQEFEEYGEELGFYSKDIWKPIMKF
jgi:hypothetical protein